MSREWAIAIGAVNACILACGLLYNSANYYAGVQALLLLETGGILVWYTAETAAIRRINQRQFELSHRQFELTQRALEQAAEDRRRSLAPKFDLREHQFSDGVVTIRLINHGARVTHLEINAEGYDATVAPSLAERDAVIRVQVHGVSVPAAPISIMVGYRDADDKFYTYTFYWVYEKGPVEYL